MFIKSLIFSLSSPSPHSANNWLYLHNLYTRLFIFSLTFPQNFRAYVMLFSSGVKLSDKCKSKLLNLKTKAFAFCSQLSTHSSPNFYMLDSKTTSVPGAIAWLCFLVLCSQHLESLCCSLHESNALSITLTSAHGTHTLGPKLLPCFLSVGVIP